MASEAGNAGPDLTGPEIQNPVTIARNGKRVREGFWKKFGRAVGHIPFAEELAAAYYCAIDSSTPMRVRAPLYAALGYFIVPTDVLPDFILGLRFSDDATVIATAVAIAQQHITGAHRAAARSILQQETARRCRRSAAAAFSIHMSDRRSRAPATVSAVFTAR